MQTDPLAELKSAAKPFNRVYSAGRDAGSEGVHGGVHLRLSVKDLGRFGLALLRLKLNVAAAALNPMSLAGLVPNAVSAVQAGLNALVWRLTKPQFVVACALSGAESGLTEVELGRRYGEVVAEALAAGVIERLWTFGVTEAYLQEARTEGSPTAINRALADLDRYGLIRRDEDTYHLTDRHIEWDFK
jgi:hypothetical protein